MQVFRPIATRLLSDADISINGICSHDIRVHDDRFYQNVLLKGSMGLGEDYMDGGWDCEDLEEMFFRLINSGLEGRTRGLPVNFLPNLFAQLKNQQTRNKSLRVAERHYNMGNDLFFSFLGKYKNYSCGYFNGTTKSLDIAQEQKMDLICRKLSLSSGDRLLDVGGGWGEIARFAADNYGCHVTSINISDEQIAYGREYCKDSSVDILKCDYRDLEGEYDKIIVIAMLTHVGHKNYRAFMEKIHSCLKDGGSALIETVGSDVARKHCEPWTNKYIFPGGLIPSISQLGEAIEGLFVIEDLHDFGPDYVKTLRLWNKNLQKGWPGQSEIYSERTRRMFEYFFLSVAGAFRARSLHNWHLVLTKNAIDKPNCRVV